MFHKAVSVKWLGFMTVLLAMVCVLTPLNLKADPSQRTAMIVDDSALFTVLPGDVVYGDENAPIRMIEYASLSCSHCKNFHDEVYGGIKEPYIDAGKVTFIYRHFPLNLPALKAAMVVDCVPEMEKKQQFVDVLFKTQGDWGFERSESSLRSKMLNIVRVGGMDEAQFDECIDNKEREDAILDRQLAAGSNLDVRSTPTLFVNGRRFTRVKTLENMTELLDSIYSEYERSQKSADEAAGETDSNDTGSGE